MQLSKKFSFLIKALMSLAFVLWLVYKVKWHEVWENIVRVEPIFLVWYVAAVALGIAFSARKWQIIAQAQGFYRDWTDCLRTYLAGTFVNNFLPGFIGGDTYRAYWLGKQHDSYAKAFSTVLFDRLTGLLMAAVLAVFFALVRYETVTQSFLWSLLVALLAAALCGIVFWYLVGRRLYRLPFVRILLMFLPVRIRNFLVDFNGYFRKEVFVPVMGFSFLFNLVGISVANFILFRAFGLSIQPLDFLAVIFLVSIIASVPVSVNNIGIKEWAYYTFFTLIHVNPETAITVALVGRFLQMLLSFLALPDFLRRKQESIPRMG